jgi:integrase
MGYEGGEAWEIDLTNQARRALYENLHHGGRDPESPYVFTSQRAERLSEAGIQHWFRSLKARARKDEWDLVHDVTFHDLRRTSLTGPGKRAGNSRRLPITWGTSPARGRLPCKQRPATLRLAGRKSRPN